MLVGSAYGKVGLDASGVKTGVQQAVGSLASLQKAGEKIGQGMKNAGNALTVGVTLPILAMGAASIKTASDFNETASKATVVFGELADSVKKNANAAATTLGLSAQNYLDYASAIAAALKAGGMGVAESAALSEQAVKHFADLASFHNTQVEEVSAAWQSAIRGQYEPIQKYFPFITNEYMKTYGVAKGLISATTENLTANQRAIILNAIALDEQLNPAINDFSETSKGLANQSRIMKAQFENLLRTLGQNLLPMALQFVTVLNAMLENFNNMGPAQQKITLGFLGIVAAAGPVLSFLGTVLTVVTQLSALFGAGGALASAGPVLATLFSGISAGVSTLLLPALASAVAAAAPFILTIGLIVAAVGLLYWAFSTNFNGISDTVKMGWFVIKFYFKQGLDYLAETVRMLGFILKTRFQQTWQALINWFKSVNWSQVGQNISMGIAAGILKGVLWIIEAARKAALAAYDTARKVLDSHSPSRKFMYLGKMSGVGYAQGLFQALDPREIAKTVARPVQAVSRATAFNQTNHFSGGLTQRDAQKMQRESERRTLKRVTTLMGD